MTIFYVSIQLGLLEFLKLMMSILMYQPALEKIIFIQAVSNNGDYGQENNSQHVTNTFLCQGHMFRIQYHVVPHKLYTDH